MGCACIKPKAVEQHPSSCSSKPSQQYSARYSGVLVKGPHSYPQSSLVRDQEQEQRALQRNGALAQGAIQNGEPVVSKRRKHRQLQVQDPKLGVLPRHAEGEQVAAGWPAWLSAVAGEAIQGWTPRRADSFEKLAKIGQGTYSNVYKARDLDSRKIVALKKVRFDNLEPESVKFMAREILVLRRLDHPNVIKLEGLVTSRISCSLYLVFEYMEHDLAGLAACPGVTFTEPQVKSYVHQLLSGLEHCHTHGVLHRDIKGSNLLLNNTGLLKITDFGLATFFHPDKHQTLTSHVVTLWYRPPELLLGATEYGVGVDLWSVGCVLGELLAGKPIMPGRTEVEQLHKIFKLCGSPSEEYWNKSKLPHATIFKPEQPYKRSIAETFKDFPASALTLLHKLLAIEPAERGTATDALNSELFSTKPYACYPSSMPQYPPSKELDAKLRDEEKRRQRNMAGKNRGDISRRATSKDGGSRAVPAPEANAELQVNLQRMRLASQSHVKSRSNKFPPAHEDSTVGFAVEPFRQELLTEIHTNLYLDHPGPSGLLSKYGPMGPRTGGKQKKRHSVDDFHMVPSCAVPCAANSMSMNAFPSQSGDLSQLSTHVASVDVYSSCPPKASRNGGKVHKTGQRHIERVDFMGVRRKKRVHSHRFNQEEAADFSKSIRGSSVLGKDGCQPLQPSSSGN